MPLADTSNKLGNYLSFLMCLALFITTYMFGYAPSLLTLSKRKSNLIAIFGAGLLVGAALEIIVPEGMSVLSKSPRADLPLNSTIQSK